MYFLLYLDTKTCIKNLNRYYLQNYRFLKITHSRMSIQQ